MRPTVYLIMSNDFPHEVYRSVDAAQRECDRLNAEDKQQHPERRIFYRVYDMELRE